MIVGSQLRRAAFNIFQDGATRRMCRNNGTAVRLLGAGCIRSKENVNCTVGPFGGEAAKQSNSSLAYILHKSLLAMSVEILEAGPDL
jgi:hypothetical protein